MPCLRGRHLLTLIDYTDEEIRFILDTAKELKHRFYAGERVIPVLRGKTLVAIYEKPSTRTRISIEVAMEQLGGKCISLSWNEMQLGRGEPIKDTARVLSRMADGISARVKKHETLEELAKYSTVPVINALSDKYHPLQALADALTIIEKKGRIEGLRIAFLGDGRNNVCHSLIVIAAKLGADVVVGTAKGYEPAEEVLKAVDSAPGSVEVVYDPVAAIRGADVVYTDVWVSMGQEAEAEKRRKDLAPFQVTPQLMQLACRDAIFMHCLPARRGEEVVDEVIEGRWSVVWDQAENRLHTAKAVFALLL